MTPTTFRLGIFSSNFFAYVYFVLYLIMHQNSPQSIEEMLRDNTQSVHRRHWKVEEKNRSNVSSVSSLEDFESIRQRVLNTSLAEQSIYITLPLFSATRFAAFEAGCCLPKELREDCGEVRNECNKFHSKSCHVGSVFGKVIVRFLSSECDSLRSLSCALIQSRPDFGLLFIHFRLSHDAIEAIFKMPSNAHCLYRFTKWMIMHFACSVEYRRQSLSTSFPSDTESKKAAQDLPVNEAGARETCLENSLSSEDAQMSDFTDDEGDQTHMHAAVSSRQYPELPKKRKMEKVARTSCKDSCKESRRPVRKEKKMSKKAEDHFEAVFPEPFSQKNGTGKRRFPRMALWEILVCFTVLILSMGLFVGFLRKD